MPGGWEGSDRSDRLPPNWRTEIRPAILQRDGYRCQIRWDDGCEGAATEVDHIRAGDDHSFANLQSACAWCHRQKTYADRQGMRRYWSAKRQPERHPGLQT
jgi:5-methylcytosine-specific restriction protein A